MWNLKLINKYSIIVAIIYTTAIARLINLEKWFTPSSFFIKTYFKLIKNRV